MSGLAAGLCKAFCLHENRLGLPLLKRWLQQLHHRTQVRPSDKLVLWESTKCGRGSKRGTEGGRAGNKKSDNKQGEHQGQEEEEKKKEEVLHGGADSHTAACGEDCGRAGVCLLKEL